MPSDRLKGRAAAIRYWASRFAARLTIIQKATEKASPDILDNNAIRNRFHG
jgi:hypothetical protein